MDIRIMMKEIKLANDTTLYARRSDRFGYIVKENGEQLLYNIKSVHRTDDDFIIETDSGTNKTNNIKIYEINEIVY